MARRSTSPPTILAGLVMLLLALALLPTPLTGFVNVLASPLRWFITPPADVLSAISTGVRRPAPAPRDAREEVDEMTVEQLVEERDEFVMAYWSQVAYAEELARLIEDMSATRVSARVPVRLVSAKRVGANLSAGTITVRAGRGQGVEPNTVAIMRGSRQIVGMVTRADAATSTVHMITDRQFQPSLVVGVALAPDAAVGTIGELETLPTLQLEAGDGRLVAPAVGADDAGRMREGDFVHVLDSSWPQASQMLILGRIARIRETDDPLFRRVEVVPIVDVDRTREAFLLVPDEGAEGGSG
jgi:hypothetical protein